MRIAIYDKNPGPGLMNAFLKLTWLIGCALHKLLGNLDDYYGADSWSATIRWALQQRRPLTSIQFWGHGSPAVLWNGGKMAGVDVFLDLAPVVSPSTLIWFRACSVFQGTAGHLFSQQLADGLGCVIAGHTRVIGVLQGGLHTRRPGQPASWSTDEGELPGALAPLGLARGSNTVSFLAANVPRGW